MFYVNLMVTAKQAPIVDTQKIQNSKHTTMENYQVTKEKSKRRKEQKRTTKTTIKNEQNSSKY